MLFPFEDTRRYQKMLRDYEHDALEFWNSLDEIPDGVAREVITGQKTADYGGGPSPFGFVVDRQGKVIGRVSLTPRVLAKS